MAICVGNLWGRIFASRKIYKIWTSGLHHPRKEEERDEKEEEGEDEQQQLSVLENEEQEDEERMELLSTISSH